MFLDLKEDSVKALENIGGKIIECLNNNIDESEALIRDLSTEQRILFFKMFEAKLLEADGKSEYRPSDHEVSLKTNREKFDILIKKFS